MGRLTWCLPCLKTTRQIVLKYPSFCTAWAACWHHYNTAINLEMALSTSVQVRTAYVCKYAMYWESFELIKMQRGCAWWDGSVQITGCSIIFAEKSSGDLSAVPFCQPAWAAIKVTSCALALWDSQRQNRPTCLEPEIQNLHVEQTQIHYATRPLGWPDYLSCKSSVFWLMLNMQTQRTEVLECSSEC